MPQGRPGLFAREDVHKPLNGANTERGTQNLPSLSASVRGLRPGNADKKNTPSMSVSKRAINMGWNNM